MKKSFTILLLLVITSAYSQFGGRLGVEFSTLNTSTDSESYTGYLGGIFYDINISDKFSVRPGVDYLYYSTDDSLFSSNNQTTLKDQIQSAVVLKFNIIPNLYLLGGPTGTYWLDIDDNSSVNSFVIGGKFGAGYSIGSYGLEFTYDVGGNMIEDSLGDLTKNAFQIALIAKF